MAVARQMIRFGILVIGILALNAFLGLEILGLTYRPFSWLTICEASETTLYPIIHKIQISPEHVALTVQDDAGKSFRLERSPSLTAPDWQPVNDPVISTGNPLVLLDTNPPQSAAFYRTKEISE